MRILLAPSAYYPHVGGIEELTRQLALTFESRGHDVSVLTNRWPEGVRRSEVRDGVRVERLRFPLPASRPRAAARFAAAFPPAALRLLSHLRGTKPDVVHVVGAGPQSAYLAFFTHLAGSALVFTAQGELTFDAHDVFRTSASLRAGLRQMLRTADVVTACSAFTLRHLEAFSPIKGPAHVVPNGVDPTEFVDAVGEERPRPYVLGVGRLVTQKGFDVLLDAFADPRLRELELVLVGDGVERAHLEQRAERLQIAERVRFVGAVDRDRVGRLLHGASLFAFPSRGEPFGIALLEAMAAGVPTVAAAAGGIPEFARRGENALLVNPEDSQALADALVRLRQDAVLRKRIIDGGRATAADLAWRTIADRYERIYEYARAGRTA
jgi:glycosyltransferase involved in cell wall biosynthesis